MRHVNQTTIVWRHLQGACLVFAHAHVTHTTTRRQMLVFHVSYTISLYAWLNAVKTISLNKAVDEVQRDIIWIWFRKKPRARQFEHHMWQRIRDWRKQNEYYSHLFTTWFVACNPIRCPTLVLFNTTIKTTLTLKIVRLEPL